MGTRESRGSVCEEPANEGLNKEGSKVVKGGVCFFKMVLWLGSVKVKKIGEN